MVASVPLCPAGDGVTGLSFENPDLGNCFAFLSANPTAKFISFLRCLLEALHLLVSGFGILKQPVVPFCFFRGWRDDAA